MSNLFYRNPIRYCLVAYLQFLKNLLFPPAEIVNGIFYWLLHAVHMRHSVGQICVAESQEAMLVNINMFLTTLHQQNYTPVSLFMSLPREAIDFVAVWRQSSITNMMRHFIVTILIFFSLIFYKHLTVVDSQSCKREHEFTTRTQFHIFLHHLTSVLSWFVFHWKAAMPHSCEAKQV